MMLINGFLGEVVGLESLLNEFSYNFALYGTPDLHAPWGRRFYRHHCAVNCLVIEGRMVLSPVFLSGTERDRPRPARRAALVDRTDRPGHRADGRTARGSAESGFVYEQMVDPAMPPGRVHPGDERHLAGAFQDNRVIPNEGVRVGDLPAPAQDLVMAIAEEFIRLLPAGPRAARLREIRERLPETWFSWIGGHEPGDVFYYRVQSPVIIAELDHHCGVFLDYDTPQPFHIHTVLRTPHGNDYGRAYVRQYLTSRDSVAVQQESATASGD